MQFACSDPQNERPRASPVSGTQRHSSRPPVELFNTLEQLTRSRSPSTMKQRGTLMSADTKPWLAHYPKQVAPEINPEQYRNILDIFDEAVRRV